MKQISFFLFLFFLNGTLWALTPSQTINLDEIKLSKIQDGETYQLSKEKSKKLVVFWATWCGTCKGKLEKTLPEMSAQNSNLEIITVNIDKHSPRAKHFVEKNRITIPVVRDEENKLIGPLNVTTAPHWAFFEKKGDHYALVASEEAFNQEKINALLK